MGMDDSLCAAAARPQPDGSTGWLVAGAEAVRQFVDRTAESCCGGGPGGHVTGARGAQIADAEVTVENLVSHQKLSAKTDSGGGFAITNLPAGEFSLTV